MQEMPHHCPVWQRRVGLPQLTPPHAMAPTNRMCLQQEEEGQESQPEVEVEEAEEDAAVPSPVLVCPKVSCPI